MIYIECGESEDQKITEGQLDFREDKESCALEEHLLHLLAACLGLPVFHLWP